MPLAQPGQRFGGRQKGTPNKIAKSARVIIAEVADRLGGADALLAWAKASKKNTTMFWVSIYPKLLPIKVQGDINNPLIARVEHAIVSGAIEEFDGVTIEHEDVTNTDDAGVPAVVGSR